VFIKWLVSAQNQARLVQASGAFPLRQSALDELGAYRQNNPQWATAVGLLSFARSEPRYQSWSTVRWALSDAATQLFRSYFSIDQVPVLVDLLDHTAEELHLGPDLMQFYPTPEPSPLSPIP
jgi:hypothetical protein